jgi:hypothetical protein
LGVERLSDGAFGRILIYLEDRSSLAILWSLGIDADLEFRWRFRAGRWS